MTTASNSEPYHPPTVSITRMGRGFRWGALVEEMRAEEAERERIVELGEAS